MPRWIALIRGINVGGHNKIPMATLSKVLEEAGCDSVRTYIQSGNVVFRSISSSKRALSQLLGDAIEREFCFRPHLLLISSTDFRTAVANNPFPQAGSEPNKLHFYFLDKAPETYAIKSLESLATPTERIDLIGNVFYLFTPDGVGRSKLASAVERKLGVTATARNYSTVQALLEMLGTRISQPPKHG